MKILYKPKLFQYFSQNKNRVWNWEKKSDCVSFKFGCCQQCKKKKNQTSPQEQYKQKKRDLEI